MNDNGTGSGELTQAELVQQQHGGALRVGNPGNRGGPGRPPSALRERLRGSLDERVAVLEEIADNPDASDRDRIKAVDILGKYGLGTVREVTVEDVREKLRTTLELLRQELDEDQADHLIGRLQTIWTS